MTMIHLRELQLEPLSPDRAATFPFSVPAIQSLAGRRLAFEAPVTIFVGENGSGKSTLLEAIASAAQSITVGSHATDRDPTLAPTRDLGKALRLSWRRRVRRGFFMRSEDFFGYVRRMQELRAEMLAELAQVEEEFAERSELARALARSPLLGQLHDMQRRYGGDLDSHSHGESYLTLFRERFVPGGLYLLDEPEAPLSPTRQITLLLLLRELAETQDAQFILATHSPILMGMPGASIYSFDNGTIAPVSFEQTEHVIVTRAFLADPEGFLRKVVSSG